jgi:putative transposase
MFRITTFHELLKGLPRNSFDRLVRSRQADKYSKGFGHWNHLVAMLYGQLSGATGLRTLEAGFNSHASHHYHLATDAVRRTTLADANAKRSDAVFSATVTWLMEQVARSARQEVRELKYLLDSTSLTLKGREFDRWTLENRTCHTQGIKVHVLLNSATEAPEWSVFTPANVNDVVMARQLPLRAGALYVFDKGYCDYTWWHSIDKAGSRFVTRFKYNAGLRVLEQRDIPADATGVVLNDEVVQFKTLTPRGGCRNEYAKPLRRVTVVRPDKATPLVLATNDMTSSALEIAQHYRDRWGIELFFKWIKQNLKIKKFFGRSENAVRIQVLTALICYLLVILFKARHGLTQTLSECLAIIRATLFQRPNSEESRYKKERRRREELLNQQPSLF